MDAQKEDVYCTLLASDSYLPGASVLAHSLRDNGTQKKLAVLVTLEDLSATTLGELRELYDYVIPVQRIANPNLENLYRLNRLDLRYSFSKIALWRQVQFRRIVYLDADVVALRAPDELFDIPASFAAAPDVGWPDCFNSGVMVISPDMGEYSALNTLAGSGISFDGADQGLLNQYFEHRPWQRLSFKYNVTPNASYQYEPAYRHFGSQISAVHFIGKEKPWQKGRDTAGSAAYKELVGRWWAVHDRHAKASPHGEGFRMQVARPSPAQQPFNAPGFREPVPQPRLAAEPEPTRPEIPLTEPVEVAEQIGQGPAQPVQPVQTSAPKSFSAPQADWDATRSAPPPESKPEASNLVSQQYTFSEDPSQFRAPQQYPEPPKDMWYEVPKEKPKPREKPKALFPWEENQAPPTRVFLEDFVEPEPELSPEPEDVPMDELAVTGDDARPRERPRRPSVQSPPPEDTESWSALVARGNAWDDVPGIERYVRVIKDAQSRRGKVQVLKNVKTGEEEIISALDVLKLPRRRESLIITDFPTEIERPSLPVTPAPIKRGTFWGEERDDKGDLPAAEGVPEQADWDPTAKLEELRRSSILSAESLKLPTPALKLPSRQLPPSSISVGMPTAVPHHSSAMPHKSILRNRGEAGNVALSGEASIAQVEHANERPRRAVPRSGGGSPSPHGLEVARVIEIDQDEPPAVGVGAGAGAVVGEGVGAGPGNGNGAEVGMGMGGGVGGGKQQQQAAQFEEPEWKVDVDVEGEEHGQYSARAHEAARVEDVLSPTER